MLAALLALALASQDRLDHWPHWRGPDGDGVAPHANPPVEWSETKNVQYKVEIPGLGSATPVVWGDKVFVLTAIDTKKEAPGAPKSEDKEGFSKGAPGTLHRFEVLCLERATGKTIWRQTAIEQAPHDGRHPTNTYASASPVTDGKVLIAPFGSRGIYAYDLDGKLLWKRSLGDMTIKVHFGEGSSPVLAGDSVLVNWDHEAGSFVTCLDAKTGEPRWKETRDEGTTWTSPVVAGTQVVVNGTKRTRSYDLATGKLLWECGGQTMNVIPIPVVREGIVYCMSGYKANAVLAIRLDSKGDVTGTNAVVWSRTDAAPYVASPLLYDGLLYYGKERNAIVSCVDAATGDLKYGPERLAGLYEIYASPVGAAGKVYFTGRNGTTVVLRAGPKLEVLAVNTLDETIDASPVPVGNQLFLRGQKHLYCLRKE